MTVRTEKQR